jgi:hypothetical protein
MTGHGGYLMQYDRMDDRDKLKMYLELEPDLVVFDQTKNELEIERLKQENYLVSQLRKEVEKLKENQARNDQKLLEELKNKGVLPND